MEPLVLASTSRYRRELLDRLRLPFEVARPDVDESPLPGETPEALAIRLAAARRTAIASGASAGSADSSTSGRATSNGNRRRSSSARR